VANLTNVIQYVLEPKLNIKVSASVNKWFIGSL